MNTRFVVCVEHDEYPASLEHFKSHGVLPDRDALVDRYAHTFDESRADYLYPERCFMLIAFSSGNRSCFPHKPGESLL